MEKSDKKPKYSDKKSIWVYLLYLGVTPCMLAAVALIIYIAVKPLKTTPPEPPLTEVVDTVM